MRNLYPVGGLALLFAATLATSVHAAETQDPTKEELVARINAVLSDEAARKEAIADGMDRSVLCAVCHGADGNSTKAGVPNLAQQNPAYLVEQIGKFARGERKNFVMQSLASNFTLQDKINLAVFFTTSKVKPGQADAELAKKGGEIYHRQCVTCHGPEGRGEEGYARIASQKVDYLETTIRRFRDIAIKREKVDEAVRHSIRMEQATQNLSDADIRAVAAFVTLLP